ncbi:MAG TPA: TetR/AcrR family transcriptional regulator [Ktedonobacterales bacterium]|nr:TetR/AcrR family transcriptional regulator [Ktedonobacterales bacterium]
MDAILDAAEICFARMGYAEATTNHIAALAGISPGSLYQYFANKEAIAQALAARYHEELQQVYAAAFASETASWPLAGWLDQVIDTLLTFHDHHPAFHILLNTPPSPDVANLTHDLPHELRRQFERGLQQRAPALPTPQLTLSATMITQLFRATLPLILTSPPEQRLLLVAELKTALQRYLDPLVG